MTRNGRFALKVFYPINTSYVRGRQSPGRVPVLVSEKIVPGPYGIKATLVQT